MWKYLERIARDSRLLVEVTGDGFRLGATGPLGIIGLLAALALLLAVF